MPTESTSEADWEGAAPIGIDGLTDRAKSDPGAPFEPATLEALVRLRNDDPAAWQRLRRDLKEATVRVPDLDRALDKLDGSNGAAGDTVGGSALLFPNPEPWPEPVDGASLLDALAETFARHVVLPAGGAEAVALWALHAHAHDTADISPILAITSPAPECGKSTLLTLLGAFVPKPLPASNITAAALFRAVEKWRPTLLVDEADTFLRDSEELRGIINSGHNRGGAFVIRTAGEDHEPRSFMTWAPKAIALIGKLAPTLASRAVHIEMRRMGLGETVEPVRFGRLGHLEPLARQAIRWTEDHDAALRAAEPDMPAVLMGRRADNWRCLFAIADVAGVDWPERARRAAEALSAGRSDETAAILLLEDIYAIFAERGEDRIPSANLAAALAALETRPWPEWSKGKPITPRGIAKLLEGFGIAPANTRIGDDQKKGYRLDQFTDAFERYLSPSYPSRRPSPQETAVFGGSYPSHHDTVGTDKDGGEPKETAAWDGGTDRIGKTPTGQGIVADSATIPADEATEWTA